MVFYIALKGRFRKGSCQVSSRLRPAETQVKNVQWTFFLTRLAESSHPSQNVRHSSQLIMNSEGWIVKNELNLEGSTFCTIHFSFLTINYSLKKIKLIIK